MKPKSTVTTADSAKVLREYATAYNIEVSYSLRFMANKKDLVEKINYPDKKEQNLNDKDVQKEVDKYQKSIPDLVKKCEEIPVCLSALKNKKFPERGFFYECFFVISQLSQ